MNEKNSQHLLIKNPLNAGFFMLGGKFMCTQQIKNDSLKAFNVHYRIKDVMKLFGIGRSTVYDLIDREILKPPIKLGRTSVFLKEEIDAVIEERKSARDSVT